MRTVGIIAEYNPFHTGHAYHIRKAKEAAGADYAVVVMSPDFVQRGEPALFDKYTRTHMALLNGADLVLELPVCYATASAEYFALGAVTLLDRLGVVDTLCFGAENETPGLFNDVAGILAEEPSQYADDLRRALRQGKTFPQARAGALAACLALKDVPNLSGFLSSPNNILGIEYCKTLRKLGSSIRPLPVSRKACSYHSDSLDGEYCSAAAIRKNLSSENTPDQVLRHIPENSRNLFLRAADCIVTQEELLPYLTQKLLACHSFDSIFDISSGLSDRILRLRFTCIGKAYGQIIAILKSRQITEAHIRRALLHLLLDIRAEDVNTYLENGTAAYIKVLGLRTDASPLLARIKKTCTLPFITKPSAGIPTDTIASRRMWEQDLFASHLYRSIQVSRTHGAFRTEYEISPLVL